MIKKEKRDKIIAQVLAEKDFAREYKQKKVTNWKTNENMYYGAKEKSQDSRANVALGRMQEFVHTLLSKIDNPLIFKFTKRKNSQLQRVENLNALREADSNQGNWDIKDVAGKKQGIIYGRAIYKYYTDNIDGYKSHLENVDVYDFLIDPSCGGIDIEQARYMGAFNIVKDKSELKEGVKSGLYIRSTTNQLIEGSGNATDDTNETEDKANRDTLTASQDRERKDDNKYKFWEWFTTYNGERYYLLMTDKGETIRCEKLKDLFASDMFPFWTWATFVDLTEFWTPSPCDYAREIFMAQDVTINQMLDNAEAINKPMRAVDVGAIKNLASLKYRRDGLIRFKQGTNINNAYQIMKTPSIDTPLKVYEVLDAIQQGASGVTSGSKGVADEGGKVGIYEGNQAAAADRYSLLNKSYSFGYTRFAKLYEWGVKENLVKKIAVDIIGVDGVEVKKVSRKDIFHKNDEYGVIVEASNADAMTSIQDQRMRLTFLGSQAGNPIINEKKRFELSATIAGITEDEIKELLDTSTYGNQKILSEADRDIESLLDKKLIRPNRMANNAYRQHFVDYMADHEEDISQDQFLLLADYVSQLDPIIIKNEARMLNKEVEDNLDQLTQPPQEGLTNNVENYETSLQDQGFEEESIGNSI